MNNQNIAISQRSIKYDIKMQYHSDLMCENYDAEITAIKESDGKITLRPNNNFYREFLFEHSDPDRVIAIASMMGAFAKMVKEENGKNIDANYNK